MISFRWINCDQSVFQNGDANIGHGNNVITPTNNRDARTMDYGSKEDESGIHLHFWNDMDNNNNYYPNIMKHIMAESMQKTKTITPTDNTDSIHINLNELMPQPQPQVSPKNQLKNALLHTLAMDEFRKSDQHLYGSNYKLYTDPLKQSPFNWNYHPSAINYIPKAYDTNINNAVQLQAKLVPAAAQQQRPSLLNLMHSTKNFIQEYYTNLHKTKSKTETHVPKYSGRLLANEPMPQEYRTFKMFEPVPRQIMLPPPSSARIPEFKPVPPRLKIIPVIDEYLETRPIPIPAPNSVPWKVIKPEEKPKLSYLYPVLKPVQIIPFKVSEAITKPPIRKYIPKTEFNFIEPSTEPYYMERPKNSKINGNITPEIATKIPKLKIYLPIHYDNNHSNIINTQSQYSYDESLNDQTLNNKLDKHQNNSKLPAFTNEDHQYEYEYTTKMNHNYNIDNEELKHVSIEDSRSTLNLKKQVQRVNNENNIVDLTRKKNAHKKSKAVRKSQRTHEKFTNDVIKLNVTGFRNVTEENNQIGKNGDSFNDDNNNKMLKKESNVKNYDKLRLHASKEYPIDSVSADSIQLSQAYSRHITNVPKPTEPTVSRDREQDSLLMQLANDVKKTLLTSLGNSSDFDEIGGIREDPEKDPFLIAIFDENDRKYNTDRESGEDLQLAETDRSDSFINANDSSNLLQRIDHDWSTDPASDPNEGLKLDVNKRNDRKHNNHRYENSYEIYNVTNNNDIANRTENDINEKQNQLNTFIDEKYYKWFSNYAEENKKLGRTVISEHFKKVEIEPNISWVVLPR